MEVSRNTNNSKILKCKFMTVFNSLDSMDLYELINGEKLTINLDHLKEKM